MLNLVFPFMIRIIGVFQVWTWIFPESSTLCKIKVATLCGLGPARTEIALVWKVNRFCDCALTTKVYWLAPKARTRVNRTHTQQHEWLIYAIEASVVSTERRCTLVSKIII